MRIAHLIITHTSPRQTERMIRNIYHKNFDFYIHVDKKLDIRHYQCLATLPNVFFIQNRVNVKRSDYSTVSAIFEGIKEITSNGAQYEYINLLSGQDYPIQPAEAIYNFFIKHTGKEFLSFIDIKHDWKEGLARIENYYLTDWEFQGKYKVEGLINKILPKRQIPYGLHPYGKSMFWTLHPDTAAFVVQKVEQDKELQHFFSYCWGSDEFVFQTILLNSPLKSKIINNNYRYIDCPAGNTSPKILDDTDIVKIKNSNMLFARKLDLDQHPKLFDLVDHLINPII